MVRWGICGTGRIAAKMVDQLAGIDDAEVVAVASRDRDRAAGFAARHGIGRSHGSHGALAGDDGVDVVYVATTQEGHHEVVLTMLEAGRAVLCEKPLAMNSTQVEQMCAASEASGVFLMEAMWSRFSQAWRRAREIVHSGDIGEPALLRADLSMKVPPELRDTHRLWDPGRGGGALMDIGIYPLNLAVFLFGHPHRVRATAVLEGTSLDRRVTAMLDQAGGVTSVVTTGIDFDGGAAATVFGTEGSVTIEPRMHASDALVVARGDRSERIPLEAPGLGIQVPEVHRCIESGLVESDVMPHAESIAMHRLTDRIRDLVGLRFDADSP